MAEKTIVNDWGTLAVAHEYGADTVVIRQACRFGDRIIVDLNRVPELISALKDAHRERAPFLAPKKRTAPAKRK